VASKLSVCMMVCNEEEKILRCLKSIESIADQLCLIDTGSKDATPAIVEAWAQEHPDIDVVVEHHPWASDFSVHRNQSLALATGDWILVLDADEWLEMCCVPMIVKNFLDDVADINVAVSCWLTDERAGNVVCGNNTIRFFRRGKGHYEDIVHNRLVLDGNNVDYCPLVKVRHDGYDLPDAELRAKMEPRRVLLMQRLNANPEDHEANLYLCQLHGLFKDYPETLKYGEAYINGAEGLKEFNDSVYFSLVMAGFAMDDMDIVKKWLEHGLTKSPNNPDLSLALSDYGFNIGNMQLCLNGSISFVGLFRKFLNDPRSQLFRFNYNLTVDRYAAALYRVSMIYLQKGATAWKALEGVIDELEPHFKQTLLSEAEQNMQQAGLAWRNQTSPVLAPAFSVGPEGYELNLGISNG
jgi:glycosyltransferase involved in cell wall biosynthesis